MWFGPHQNKSINQRLISLCSIKKMKSILTIIIVLVSCHSLKFNSEKLIGKWECYHKELEDGTTKSTDLFSGEEFEYSCNGLILELKSDFTGWESLGEQTFKYELKDSILTLGNRSYLVELLNKEELIIRDYDKDGFSISNFRQKFKRIK